MIAKSTDPAIWCPKVDAERIADRLRTAVHCLGLSCAEVARLTGSAYQTIDGYLSGKRVPDTVHCVLLVQALNFPSVDVLLFGRPRSQWDRLREND